jgi:phage tail-like protein
MTAAISAGIGIGVGIGFGGAGAASEQVQYPVHTFRFHVHFTVDSVDGNGDSDGAERAICGGAFSECTGLEATMEAKAIKEGGRNYGTAQRPGQVTFATVILKRGMTTTRDMWTWFDLVTRQHAFAHRLAATVNVYDPAGNAVFAWKLANALPVKFKGADLNARGTEVGVEELHLVHEGLSMASPSHPTVQSIR